MTSAPTHETAQRLAELSVGLENVKSLILRLEQTDRDNSVAARDALSVESHRLMALMTKEIDHVLKVSSKEAETYAARSKEQEHRVEKQLLQMQEQLSQIRSVDLKELRNLVDLKASKVELGTVSTTVTTQGNTLDTLRMFQVKVTTVIMLLMVILPPLFKALTTYFFGTK